MTVMEQVQFNREEPARAKTKKDRECGAVRVPAQIVVLPAGGICRGAAVFAWRARIRSSARRFWISGCLPAEIIQPRGKDFCAEQPFRLAFFWSARRPPAVCDFHPARKAGRHDSDFCLWRIRG